MLTDLKVKQARAKEKPYKAADSNGLYLLIHPNGSKYWRFKYRFEGKENVYSIGAYPVASLSDARKERDKARKDLFNGINPNERKRHAKLLKRSQAQNSFKSIALEWFDKKKGKWKASHAAQVLKSLEHDVFPSLGSLPIHDIKAPQIKAVVKRVEKRGALDVASRVLQRINRVFKYAIAEGKIDNNPAAALDEILTERKTTHHKALDRKELPEFLSKLNNYDGEPLTRLALRLIILTFVRSMELRGANWSEFDLESAQWRIPDSRMKGGDTIDESAYHLVPLSRQAIETLREIQPLTGQYALAFPGQVNHAKPMSENTLLYAMYRMGYHGRATVHGFRATASTILNESGFNHDAIEAQLAHTERNKARKAYNRALYLEDRKNLMQWWADYLDGIKASSNVIPGNFSKSG